MSAGMTLFLELKFEPFALSIALFVICLLFAFSGVWLINSLQEEEGEGEPKGVGAVRDGREEVIGGGWGDKPTISDDESKGDEKPTISEAVSNDDVEMALGRPNSRACACL